MFMFAPNACSARGDGKRATAHPGTRAAEGSELCCGGGESNPGPPEEPPPNHGAISAAPFGKLLETFSL